MGAPLAAAADTAAGAAVSSSSAARLASGFRLYASPEYRDKGCSLQRNAPQRRLVHLSRKNNQHFSYIRDPGSYMSQAFFHVWLFCTSQEVSNICHLLLLLDVT